MTEETKQTKSLFKKIFSKAHTETVRETIEDLIEDSIINGLNSFSEHEQLLLNNILYIKEKKCCHTMIPSANIIAFQRDGSIGDLAELMSSKGHSRIPIYDTSLDDITGLIHLIDLVKSLKDGQANLPVSTIEPREVKFVSPSMRVLDLLRNMQSNKMHMALVVDEYGGVDGLITIEDLLEEIVGDIEDEYDFEEAPVIIKAEENVIIADARAELYDVEKIAGIKIYDKKQVDESETETLNGLIFQLAQRIPTRGEIIKGYKGIKFRILDVDQRRIKKVLIMLPKKD